MSTDFTINDKNSFPLDLLLQGRIWPNFLMSSKKVVDEVIDCHIGIADIPAEECLLNHFFLWGAGEDLKITHKGSELLFLLTLNRVFIYATQRIYGLFYPRGIPLFIKAYKISTKIKDFASLNQRSMRFLKVICSRYSLGLATLRYFSI